MADTMDVPPKILLAFGQPQLRILYAAIVTAWNPDIVLETAGTLEELVSKARTGGFDAVIAEYAPPGSLDCAQEGLDGIQAASRLRQEGSQVPIIIVSSYPDAELYALLNGANKFIVQAGRYFSNLTLPDVLGRYAPGSAPERPARTLFD
ncbi:MAG: hypothetical protein HY518_00010 [Candidatus Aenigmarchaeota archaeon]|nr:hypothetical protein [Candidatus Aenigmarchaeota archaeon]